MQVTIGFGELAAAIAAFATIVSFFWWIIANQIARSAELLRSEQKAHVELFHVKIGQVVSNHDRLERDVDRRFSSVEGIVGRIRLRQDRHRRDEE